MGNRASPQGGTRSTPAMRRGVAGSVRALAWALAPIVAAVGPTGARTLCRGAAHTNVAVATGVVSVGACTWLRLGSRAARTAGRCARSAGGLAGVGDDAARAASRLRTGYGPAGRGLPVALEHSHGVAWMDDLAREGTNPFARWGAGAAPLKTAGRHVLSSNAVAVRSVAHIERYLNPAASSESRRPIPLPELAPACRDLVRVVRAHRASVASGHCAGSLDVVVQGAALCLEYRTASALPRPSGDDLRVPGPDAVFYEEAMGEFELTLLDDRTMLGFPDLVELRDVTVRHCLPERIVTPHGRLLERRTPLPASWRPAATPGTVEVWAVVRPSPSR